jgi:hypothetical protein
VDEREEWMQLSIMLDEYEKFKIKEIAEAKKKRANFEDYMKPMREQIRKFENGGYLYRFSTQEVYAENTRLMHYTELEAKRYEKKLIDTRLKIKTGIAADSALKLIQDFQRRLELREQSLVNGEKSIDSVSKLMLTSKKASITEEQVKALRNTFFRFIGESKKDTETTLAGLKSQEFMAKMKRKFMAALDDVDRYYDSDSYQKDIDQFVRRTSQEDYERQLINDYNQAIQNLRQDFNGEANDREIKDLKPGIKKYLASVHLIRLLKHLQDQGLDRHHESSIVAKKFFASLNAKLAHL